MAINEAKREYEEYCAKVYSDDREQARKQIEDGTTEENAILPIKK